MEKVVLKILGNTGKPMSEQEVKALIAKVFPIPDNESIDDFYAWRLGGKHCNCTEGGVFKLYPENSKLVQEGGKRYMECVNCGDVSHL